MPPLCRIGGFSLIELLCILGVLAVLFLFSIPFGESLHSKNQLQLRTDEIKRIILFSKTQSLLLGETLALVPVSATNNWSPGMRLLRENDQDNEGLIHKWQWSVRGASVEWHGFQSDQRLIFASNIRHSAINGYFIIQNKSGTRRLVINRLGRIKEE